MCNSSYIITFKCLGQKSNYIPHWHSQRFMNDSANIVKYQSPMSSWRHNIYYCDNLCHNKSVDCQSLRYPQVSLLILLQPNHYMVTLPEFAKPIAVIFLKIKQTSLDVWIIKRDCAVAWLYTIFILFHWSVFLLGQEIFCQYLLRWSPTQIYFSNELLNF